MLTNQHLVIISLDALGFRDINEHQSELPTLNKLIQFSTKFKADSEANSELASREAEDTKKNIVTELKSLPQETLDVAPSATKVTAPVSGSDDFFF